MAKKFKMLARMAAAPASQINSTFFQCRNPENELVNIDGIINPLCIDNRQTASMTDQQGDRPYCAAYSAAQYAEAVNWKRTGKLVQLDAGQIYKKAKTMDGIPDEDGTFIEVALQSAIDLGCFSSTGKIMQLKNDQTKLLPEKIKFLVHKYDFIQAGFSITDGWYSCSKRSPVLKHTDNFLGGHAVLIVGYTPQDVIIQNQWGIDWGSKGFALMPWDVFMKEFIYCSFLSDAFHENN